MTDRELADAFAALRPLVARILGFNDISASGKGSALGQVIADAHVYAGGVQLATEVLRIADALEERG
ncbi:MAG: hypothetical protein U1E62_14905 [Alsobacter sp.]